MSLCYFFHSNTEELYSFFDFSNDPAHCAYLAQKKPPVRVIRHIKIGAKGPSLAISAPKSVQYVPPPVSAPEKSRLKIIRKVTSPSAAPKEEPQTAAPPPPLSISQSTQTSVIIRATQEPVQTQAPRETTYRVPESQMVFRWQNGQTNTPQHDVTFSDNLE